MNCDTAIGCLGDSGEVIITGCGARIMCCGG